MRNVIEKKDTQEETECIEILCSTKQTEHMILDIHVDNKNDNIKENPYQCKEVAVNITHMATKNQEITHNPLQTDQMSLDIDTGNTKVHIPEDMAKYKRFAGHMKNLANRLTRITVGDNQKKNLEIRKQHKLTLHGLPGNTAEVLLLRQVRHLKAKAVYIPVNANFNPRRSAFVYFSSNEDLLRAYKSKVNYGNSLLYWKFCEWAKSKNNSTQQEGAETSSKYKSWKKLKVATVQAEHSNPRYWKGISKKEGLGSANLKGKEKKYLTDDVGYIIKDKFMRINKAEESRKMKTSEDYQVLKLTAQTSLPMKKKLAEILKTEDIEKTDVLQLLRKRIRKLDTFCRRMRKRVLILQEEKELHELCKDIEKNYEIDTFCEQTQDTEE
ncbi:23298_t:CDS:2, partial [Gigaspora margarita]